jgi:hypothetical protein
MFHVADPSQFFFFERPCLSYVNTRQIFCFLAKYITSPHMPPTLTKPYSCTHTVTKPLKRRADRWGPVDRERARERERGGGSERESRFRGWTEREKEREKERAALEV